MMIVRCGLYNHKAKSYDYVVETEVDDNISTSDLTSHIWNRIADFVKDSWFPMITSDIFKLIREANLNGGFAHLSWFELELIPLD